MLVMLGSPCYKGRQPSNPIREQVRTKHSFQVGCSESTLNPSASGRLLLPTTDWDNRSPLEQFSRRGG